MVTRGNQQVRLEKGGGLNVTSSLPSASEHDSMRLQRLEALRLWPDGGEPQATLTGRISERVSLQANLKLKARAAFIDES